MEAMKYSKLINVGQFYGGLSGKTKEDFEDGNAKFITYMNVFSNPSLKTDIEDKVRIKEGEKQNVVKYGDVIFTGSSETPEECGMSSVLEEHTEEPLYLNSFCFGYRFNDIQAVVPAFFKHLFRSNSIRAKIAKTANGVTRFNVSKKLFGEIEIPLPPLPIQQEIVRILDSFTSMITNLETELASRQKQYEYYRNKLLTFDENDETVEWKTLGEISTKVCSGGTPSRGNKAYFEGQIPWLRTQEVDWCEVYDTELKITEEAIANSSAKFIPANCVIVAMYGATAGKSCINKIPLTTNQACCNLQINEDVANYMYVYYCVCKEYENLKAMGEGSQNNINAQKIKSYKIPMPHLRDQQEIVSTLDTFESLITNIKQELDARKKQYEYYREKLLTFE